MEKHFKYSGFQRQNDKESIKTQTPLTRGAIQKTYIAHASNTHTATAKAAAGVDHGEFIMIGSD